LRCTLYSGAELSDDKGSPLPGVRVEENEKTREKMQLVRSQMENMSLMKQRKAKVGCLLLLCCSSRCMSGVSMQLITNYHHDLEQHVKIVLDFIFHIF